MQGMFIMKNTIVWGALAALLCTQVQAQEQTVATQNLVTAVATPQLPATVPASTEKPVETTPVQPVNCTYTLPPKIQTVDKSIVSTWAMHAAIQSFSFDFEPTRLEAQLNALENCYTKEGWIGFYDALKKSGNLEAIKNQKLIVSSQVQGTPTWLDTTENQWKLSLPLQVIYQKNEQQKITQTLTVELVIGRKPSGQLGILQLVAYPPRTTAPAATTTTPAATTTTTTTTTTPVQPVTPSMEPKP
jgi:hypothetical protein